MRRGVYIFIYSALQTAAAFEGRHFTFGPISAMATSINFDYVSSSEATCLALGIDCFYEIIVVYVIPGVHRVVTAYISSTLDECLVDMTTAIYSGCRNSVAWYI
jgi:hypothetical protein